MMDLTTSGLLDIPITSKHLNQFDINNNRFEGIQRKLMNIPEWAKAERLEISYAQSEIWRMGDNPVNQNTFSDALTGIIKIIKHRKYR